MIQKKLMQKASLLLIVATFTSCEKNLDLSSDGQTETSPRAITSNRIVNWINRSVDNDYTSSEAGTDFGNVSGWDNGLTSITNNSSKTNGALRVKLLPNLDGGASGLVTNIDVSDGNAYRLRFRVRFDSGFDWRAGGKLGFGIKIGEGYTGGGQSYIDTRTKGDGASVRLMWKNTNQTNNKPRFIPYVYYKDMNTDGFGEDFNAFYPKLSVSNGLTTNTWYNVEIYVKTNSVATGSTSLAPNNGILSIKINGDTLYDNDKFRYTSTTNTSLSSIRNISFETFRGGDGSIWQSSTNGYISFQNVSWEKL
jgi:hypothetical protein